MNRVAVVAVLFAWTGVAAGQGAKKPDPKAEKKPAVKLPDGWTEYTSEAKDFVVFLPGETSETESKQKEQTIRGLTATKGDARLTVMLFENRTGETQKENYLKTVPNDIDVVQKSIKQVKLGVLEGLQYDKKESDGTTATYRVYRSKDGKTMVTLMILKSTELKAEEKAAFLESFRFVEKK